MAETLEVLKFTYSEVEGAQKIQLYVIHVISVYMIM